MGTFICDCSCRFAKKGFLQSILSDKTQCEMCEFITCECDSWGILDAGYCVGSLFQKVMNDVEF